MRERTDRESDGVMKWASKREREGEGEKTRVRDEKAGESEM